MTITVSLSAYDGADPAAALAVLAFATAALSEEGPAAFTGPNRHYVYQASGFRVDAYLTE